MVLASVTESLVNFCVDAINSLGLAGVFVLMLAESACIPFPSEATMLFAGFDQSLVLATIVGVAGNLVGSWIAYGVGYYGRTDLLEKHGAKLHVKPSDLARADAWFARYGGKAVFFARMLPVVRTFISLPAGVARMPFGRFTALTVAGCVPWVFVLTLIGNQAGKNWKDWKDHLHYLDYAVLVAIVVGIVYLVLRRRRATAAAA